MPTRYPIEWIRAQFPALASGLAYLDNAAGSQVPRHVVDRVSRVLVEANANRGAAHAPSERMEALRHDAKQRTAALLDVEAHEVFFGANATTLLTLLADAWRRALRPGDEVIVTGLDHQANVDPWTRLAECGIVVRRWPVRLPHASLDLADLDALVTPRTKLLAISGASNALGTRADTAGAADIVHAAGGVVCVDAVHLAAHQPPEPRRLGADMLVFSPYKVFGPHLGVLWISGGLDPPAHGLSFMDAGHEGRWETGTQNHEGIAGWGAVFDYLDECAVRMDVAGPAGVFSRFAEHERSLTAGMLDGLRALGAEIYGLPTEDDRTSTVSFNLPGRKPRAVAESLASRGVCVSDGHYYAHDLMMRTLGLAGRGGAVRASAVHYTSQQDVHRLLEALTRAP